MKNFKFNLKYLKYLFWLGPMLVLAGLTAGVVSASWGAVPLGMIIAGIVILALWLLFLSRFEESPNQPGFWRRRSTQAGANALVTTIAVVAILGLINFLGTRSVARLDLTENQTFTLAPETQQLVRNLKQPVKAWVFDPQQNAQDRELLESYRRLGQNFSYEFVSPNAQPALAQQFEVKKVGDVYVNVAATNRKQFVQTVSAQERLTEAKLTNAIAQVTSDKQAVVYMVQGHGERPIDQGQESISQAAKALQDKGYTVKPLNLTESATLPQDASVVIIAGPQKAFLQGEVAALSAYIKQGGNVLLMVDPTANPGLDDVFKDWGISLDPRVVIDASKRVVNLGPADVTVTQYSDHPITKDFGTNLSFFTAARAVDVKQIAGIQATPLLITSNNTWAESDLKKQPVQFDPQVDRKGPLVLAFALSRSLDGTTPKPTPSPSPGTPKKEVRLVVIGNSSFAADGFFSQVINGDVFLNSVRWLSQQEQPTLSIRPKEAKNRRITLSGQQANLAAWLALVILPLLGFGTAAVVWWRRR